MYSIFVNLLPALAERPVDDFRLMASAPAMAAVRRPAPSLPTDACGSHAAAQNSLPMQHALDVQACFPALWRAQQLDASSSATTATGFPVLNAELPGGGWPHRVLTELLLPHLGVGELRLLVPALARIAGASEGARSVMLFDPPAALCGRALVQMGVQAQQMLVVHGREGARAAAGLRRVLPSADLLWALEQALKSGHVGAVLAWLPPRLKADALRRLQLAAQSHDGPAFLFRDVDARLKPSAAPLRLLLQSAGIDRLSVRVLKRRGSPLLQPLVLALPPVLSDRLRVRGEAGLRAAANAKASHGVEVVS